jgi:hypothetical protein
MVNPNKAGQFMNCPGGITVSDLSCYFTDGKLNFFGSEERISKKREEGQRKTVRRKNRKEVR